MFGRIVPPIPTTRPLAPVRIHSASAPGGDSPFSPNQLAKAVANWHRYQSQQNPAFPKPVAVYIPPADVGIGHEYDQAFARGLLQRTDIPSCGRPVKLWMQGPDLYAELSGVPEPVARMANAGQFSEVSAEIWPNYRTPDGKSHGPVLRRISLLGGHPPRQKGLGSLPPFVYEFAEPARGGRPSQQLAILFSEGPFTMTKEQALAVLQAAGVDTTAWANADDQLVISFAQWVQSNQTGNGNMGTGINAPVAQFGEMVQRQLALATAPLMQTVQAMRTEFGAIAAKNTQQECETFAESHKKKLFAFESDPKSDKYVVARLLKLAPDARRGEMDAIASRPDVAQFGERMPDGTSGNVNANGGSPGPVPAERRTALLQLTPGGRALLARQQRQALKN